MKQFRFGLPPGNFAPIYRCPEGYQGHLKVILARDYIRQVTFGHAAEWQIAKTSSRYQSNTEMSYGCLIYINLRVFDIWDMLTTQLHPSPYPYVFVWFVTSNFTHMVQDDFSELEQYYNCPSDSLAILKNIGTYTHIYIYISHDLSAINPDKTIQKRWYIGEFQYQEPVSRAWISNHIPQSPVGYNSSIHALDTCVWHQTPHSIGYCKLYIYVAVFICWYVWMWKVYHLSG